MQLLNSNIPRMARAAKYNNKKAQDPLNLVLFMFCNQLKPQKNSP